MRSVDRHFEDALASLMLAKDVAVVFHHDQQDIERISLLIRAVNKLRTKKCDGGKHAAEQTNAPASTPDPAPAFSAAPALFESGPWDSNAQEEDPGSGCSHRPFFRGRKQHNSQSIDASAGTILTMQDAVE